MFRAVLGCCLAMLLVPPPAAGEEPAPAVSRVSAEVQELLWSVEACAAIGTELDALLDRIEARLVDTAALDEAERAALVSELEESRSHKAILDDCGATLPGRLDRTGALLGDGTALPGVLAESATPDELLSLAAMKYAYRTAVGRFEASTSSGAAEARTARLTRIEEAARPAR